MARAAGGVLGPLHGVPFTIKDSFDTAGLVTTVGTVGWRHRVPSPGRDGRGATQDSGRDPARQDEYTRIHLVRRDRQRRLRPHVEPVRPRPHARRQQWGTGRDRGCRWIPVRHRQRHGDSIRQPAHVCGVAGIKPTSGRVPRTGHSPGYRGLFESFTQLGPLARRVEDLELVLPIIVGPDGEDPHVAPVALGRPGDVDLASLRIVTFTDNAIRTPTPETVTAVQSAARSLADAGATVEERLPPGLDEAWAAWDALIRADGFAWLQRLITEAGTAGMGSYDTRGWVEVGPALPGDQLTALVERADAIRARLSTWMRDVDLIVCPAMPQPAIRHGDSTAAWFGDTVQRRPQPDRLAGRRRPWRDISGGPPDRSATGRRAVARRCRARSGPGRRGSVGRVAAATAVTRSDEGRRHRCSSRLDYVYMPSRDVAGRRRVFHGRPWRTVVFAIDGMGTRVAMIELTDGPPRILLADHLEGDRPILVYRVDDLEAAARSCARVAGTRATASRSRRVPFARSRGPVAIAWRSTSGRARVSRRASRVVATSRSGVPGDRQATGACRNTTPVGGVAPAPELRSRPADPVLPRGRPGSPGGPDAADAGVRTLGEGKMRPGVPSRDVEPVRVRERGRIAIGRRQRHDDEVATADRSRRRARRRGRVAVDARRPPARAEAIPRPRSRPATGRPRTAVEGARRRQHVPEQRGRHALARLDAAEHHHRGVGHDLASGQRGGRLGKDASLHGRSSPPTCRSRAATASGARSPISPPADTRSTAATISSYQPSTTPGSTSRSSSAAATTRTASGPARSRRISARPRGRRSSTRSRRLARALDRANRSITCGRRNAAANGSRWRRCSSPSSESMLGPTTLRRREARIVDREPRRVAHDLDAQVAARHDPAVEDGHPGDRLALAQASPGVVGLRVELCERDRRAEAGDVRASSSSRSTVRRRGGRVLDRHGRASGHPIIANSSYLCAMRSVRAQRFVGLLLAGVLALAIAPATEAAARTAFDLDLGRRADYVAQTNLVQCVGASMQMMLNMMQSRNDRTATTQLASSKTGARPGAARRRNGPVGRARASAAGRPA